VLKDLKRLDEALASYDKAIALKPEYAEAFVGRALCRLLCGRYEAGWNDYEWRWHSAQHLGKRPNIDAPYWQGENFRGHRLLVFSEQGLGDIVQFVRYLPPLLVQSKLNVTFLTEAKLIRLLRPATMDVETVSTPNADEAFDAQIALGTLPLR